jgi:hypothetical protein
MKKIFSFVLIILLIVLTGCTDKNSIVSSSKITFESSRKTESSVSGNNSMSPAEQEDLNKHNERINNILLLANNKKDYKEFVTKKIDLYSIEEKYFYYMYGSHISSLEPRTLINFNNDLNIECLRRSSDSTAYSIHETISGGVYYAFFRGVRKMHNGLYKDWVLNCSIYSCKKLYYKDFESVKKGTTMNEIESVDPSIKIYIHSNKKRIEDSKHLLVDGLLLIFYDFKDGKYIVSSKMFFNDFRIPGGSDGDFYDYKIFEQDYIH